MRLAAALALLGATACSDSAADRAKRAGAELASGLVSALEASSDNATPRLCAAWPAASSRGPGRFDLGGATAEVSGATLVIEAGGDDRPALAAVADARGSSQAAVRARRLAKQFREAGVRVVVALGGMGRNKTQLVAALEPLVDARWALVAMPGDRESVPALRAAIAELGRGGRPVFDGSAIRAIDAGDLRAITLPGIASDAGLAAGAEGCIHRPADAAEVAAKLAARDGSRLVLSYAAPRQRGDGGSDLADGVHSGEPELASLAAESRAHLIVHGQIELPPGAAGSGAIAGRERGKAVAVGSLERSPALLGMGGSGYAGVIATASKGGVRWRRTRP